VPASLSGLSARLAEIVDALPLLPGMRVLEIGGAPGTAAKEVAKRAGPSGHVLVIDRSAKGVALTERNAAAEIAGRLMSVRHVAAEEFLLQPDERPFDRAFAVRVGTLDGRLPGNGVLARSRIAAALVPGGRLLIDGGNPLREIDLRLDRL
jgi:precorrin-6B methylase 2